MPTISVSKHGELVDSVPFGKQFIVIQAGEKISWAADNELAGEAAGEIHFWIRLEMGNVYSIVFIRPDWNLSVDHVSYPSGFYQDITTNNRLIEAGYHEFVFVCQ